MQQLIAKLVTFAIHRLHYTESLVDPSHEYCKVSDLLYIVHNRWDGSYRFKELMDPEDVKKL